MAGDSPNTFASHEGDMEGQSEEDEIPREAPAYRRAYAALCRAQADGKDGILGGTGKSSQTPVARHRCLRTRQGCEDSGRGIWLGRNGDHTRSWNKSCVMPFEREKAAAQSKQSSMQRPWIHHGVGRRTGFKKTVESIQGGTTAGREVHTVVGQF